MLSVSQNRMILEFSFWTYGNMEILMTTHFMTNFSVFSEVELCPAYFTVHSFDPHASVLTVLQRSREGTYKTLFNVLWSNDLRGR